MSEKRGGKKVLVQLPQCVLSELDAQAVTRGTTRSELIREFCRNGLDSLKLREAQLQQIRLTP